MIFGKREPPDEGNERNRLVALSEIAHLKKLLAEKLKQFKEKYGE